MPHDDYKKSDLNRIKPNQLFHLLSSLHISEGALCTIGFHPRAEKSRAQQGPDVCGSGITGNPEPPRQSLLSPFSPANLTRRNWHRGKQRALARSTEFPQRINTNDTASAFGCRSAPRVQMSSRNGEERVLVSKTGKAEPKFRSIMLFLHRI